MRGSIASLFPKPCPADCPSARLAAAQSPENRLRKASSASLIALMIPALGMAVALVWAAGSPGWEWIFHGKWPWQLWMVAVSGSAATLAGIVDWLFHRLAAKCAISRKERRCELLALAAGGVPVFAMMLAASVSARPLQWLLPVLVAVLFTTSLICYDEFIFHRKRCNQFETRLHRVLVFGNGLAWLAWAHWCFVERAGALV